MTRLGYSRWLLARNELQQARRANVVPQEISGRFGMTILAVDTLVLEGEIAEKEGDEGRAGTCLEASRFQRHKIGFLGPSRP